MNASVDPAEARELPLEFSDRHGAISILGFWLFIGSDIVLFSCLFAVYATYWHRFAGGPTPADLFRYGPALLETLLLLSSSFACGLAMYQLRRRDSAGVTLWLLVTIVLGLAFVILEIREFVSYVGLGATWHRSAFLSAFFTLVGTHGGHVSFGILWAVSLVLQLWRRGLNAVSARKLYVFSIYWHFLDIIWVFIFSTVYLGSKIG